MDIFQDIKRVPFASEHYPKEWKMLSDAPEVVYAVGDLNLLKERKLVMIGSRRTPAAILKHAQGVAQGLSSAFCLVTGVADGGDSAAIEGALQGGGKIICVLAGGFEQIPSSSLPLLRQVEKHGLILSPYPLEASVRAFSFAYRNKLLAALGEGVFVIGAGEKSGALITAGHAKNMQKPIFAFPYPPNAFAGKGCNALLKTGGILVENAEDIFEKFGVEKSKEKRKTVGLTEAEQALYQAIQEMSEGHLSEIAAQAQTPIFKAKAIASSLEAKGLIVSVGGNRYSVV